MKTDFVLFSFDYPPQGGGISRLCSYISKGLFNKQILYQVLTEGDVKEPNVVRVSKLRILREVQSILWLLVNTKRTTPILTGTWYPEALLSLLAFRKNVFILAHGTEVLPANNFIKEIIWKLLRSSVLSGAKLCIANSHFTKELVLKSAPKANAVALPLAVDSEKFHILSDQDKNGDKLTIGTVSRLHAYKGFDTVLMAIAELPQQLRDKIQYKIVGSGPYKKELLALISKLNLDKQVQFVGALDEQELIRFYNSIDLFVMCSRLSLKTQDVEGFGLVYLEAQACGAPVIATRSGGIPDAVTDQEGGWLIEESDHVGLSEKLRSFLEAPEILKAASVAARQRTEKKYSWSGYMQGLLNLVGDI